MLALRHDLAPADEGRLPLLVVGRDEEAQATVDADNMLRLFAAEIISNLLGHRNVEIPFPVRLYELASAELPRTVEIRLPVL